MSRNLVSFFHKSSRVQRIALFFWSAAAIFLVVLHNPGSGYNIMYMSDPTPCPNTDVGVSHLTQTQLETYMKAFEKCEPHTAEREFREWATYDPVIKWMGPVLNVLIAELAITLIAGMIWWLFPHNRNSSAS
jgi:hypothetical protein